MKLNVGCGRNILAGWVNVDVARLPGVDLVVNLEECADRPIPLDDDCVEELLLAHVIEHIRNPLPLMQELWRVAKPGAKMTIRVPHGGSDDAWEDPTHVRAYFAGSFGYFSQPWYWRADYGYRGDWQADKINFVVNKNVAVGLNAEQLLHKINAERNIVQELVAELSCKKPAREPKVEHQTAAALNILLV